MPRGGDQSDILACNMSLSRVTVGARSRKGAADDAWDIPRDPGGRSEVPGGAAPPLRLGMAGLEHGMRRGSWPATGSLQGRRAGRHLRARPRRSPGDTSRRCRLDPATIYPSLEAMPRERRGRRSRSPTRNPYGSLFGPSPFSAVRLPGSSNRRSDRVKPTYWKVRSKPFERISAGRLSPAGPAPPKLNSREGSA